MQQWHEQFAAQGRAIILQKQFEVAEKGNVTMLKWMGKQHLNQRDHVDILHKAEPTESEKDAIPDGFQILAPHRQLEDQSKNIIDVTPGEPASEVEAVLVKELTPRKAPAQNLGNEIVISGHTEEP